LVVGLNDWESRPERITGVAIYPYWETSDDEWSQYRSLWVTAQPASLRALFAKQSQGRPTEIASFLAMTAE
jgi:hypothetical protein